jgi:hypothetical protein
MTPEVQQGLLILAFAIKRGVNFTVFNANLRWLNTVFRLKMTENYKLIGTYKTF